MLQCNPSSSSYTSYLSGLLRHEPGSRCLPEACVVDMQAVQTDKDVFPSHPCRICRLARQHGRKRCRSEERGAA